MGTDPHFLGRETKVFSQPESSIGATVVALEGKRFDGNAFHF